MGIEFEAFLGRISDLGTWKSRLPSAVVCELGGELGLVPVTSKLLSEFPSPGGALGWGREASTGTAVAYVNIFEFGNQGHHEATLWVDGKDVLASVRTAEVIEYFRDHLGFDAGHSRAGEIKFDLEDRFRGDNAAEKWAASAAVQTGSGRPSEQAALQQPVTNTGQTAQAEDHQRADGVGVDGTPGIGDRERTRTPEKESVKREVTKEEFKRLYFQYATPDSGWDESYWNHFFESENGKRYFFTPPASQEENRVFIVSGGSDYHMFFMTEESEESFFSFPEESQDTEQRNESPQPMPTINPEGSAGLARQLPAEPAKRGETYVPFSPQGWGIWLFWVPILWFVLILLLLPVVDKYFCDIRSRFPVFWIMATSSFMFSAVVAFGMAYHTNHSQPRKELESRTGREWFRRPIHSLFWLRPLYWGIAYLVIGLAFLFWTYAAR